MFSHPTNNIICTEPSPKTPTEKFFESEVASSSSNSSTSLDETTMSSTSGSSDNGSAGKGSVTECTSSPTLSDASSGYESMLDDSSQPDGHLHNMATVNFEAVHEHQQQQVLPSAAVASEAIFYTVAPRDSQILDDFRATRQMLLIEDRYVPWGVDEVVYYCSKHESDERARRIVTEWMLEVCEELKCEEVTFSLAVNYLDRFLLATPDLRKFQLQLVAVVCLLIASKLRQCESLDPKELSYMSDNSVTVAQILSWEPLVLKRLNWDVSSVLAIDYLDHILVKLPELCAAGQQNPPSSSPLRSSNILSQSSSSAISSPRSTKRPFSLTTSSSPSSSSSCPSSGQKRFRSCDHFVSCKVPEQSSLSNSFSSLHDTVRRHASTLISLCSTELQFACVRPSVIAAACVATAVRGIFQRAQCSYSIDSTFAFFSAQLQIDIDSKSIRFYMNQIERLIDLRSSKLSNNDQLATNAVEMKNKILSKATTADMNQVGSSQFHANQLHFVHSLTQQHFHSYLPYHHHRSSVPAHRHPLHTSIHSINGAHSPNSSCIGGSAASAAAAAASSTTTASSMSHSPSRFSPITFHHLHNVPTAQVPSAKMLLMEQQQRQSPQNRVHHLRQQHIPEASSFLARCSQPSVAHNHLHDLSNTSTFSSSSPFGSNNSNNHFDGNIFKSKLINLNCLSEDSFTSTLLSPSSEQSLLIFDDEDRENMAPGAATGESNSSDNSLLLSTEDLSDFLSDDEDENLHEFY